MCTHIYKHNVIKTAVLGLYCSSIIKGVAEKFTVLQIQTTPSHLRPASARCCLAASSFHRWFTMWRHSNCPDERYISWYKCSLQVDTTIGPNPILYFYCVENVEILVIWNAIREFVTEKLIQLWWNAAAQGRPRMSEAISVSCQVAT